MSCIVIALHLHGMSQQQLHTVTLHHHVPCEDPHLGSVHKTGSFSFSNMARHRYAQFMSPAYSALVCLLTSHTGLSDPLSLLQNLHGLLS